MDRRLKLQKELETILGTRNVYFQPPESIKMNYPAIRYELNNVNIRYANNVSYQINREYSVILIDSNPDNTLIDEILKIPMCRFDRAYKSDNLNHYAFTLVY